MHVQPAPDAPAPISATIHIYRGLMDRAASWRQRIDLPTNWAITTAGATTSFVLSDIEHSHAVLLLVMLLTVAFLAIEARRFRYYDLWASWVRVLETDYFATILRSNEIGANQPWQHMLVHDFDDPLFKAHTWQFVARRLRDIYCAVFGFLLASWLLKLLIHQPADQGIVSNTFVGRAAVGPIPGLVVLAVVFTGYGALLIMMLVWRNQAPDVEVLSRERMLLRMVSPDQEHMSRRQSQAAMLARFRSDADDEPLTTKDWD